MLAIARFCVVMRAASATPRTMSQLTLVNSDCFLKSFFLGGGGGSSEVKRWWGRGWHISIVHCYLNPLNILNDLSISLLESKVCWRLMYHVRCDPFQIWPYSSHFRAILVFHDFGPTIWRYTEVCLAQVKDLIIPSMFSRVFEKKNLARPCGSS